MSRLDPRLVKRRIKTLGEHCEQSLRVAAKREAEGDVHGVGVWKRSAASYSALAFEWADELGVVS